MRFRNPNLALPDVNFIIGDLAFDFGDSFRPINQMTIRTKPYRKVGAVSIVIGFVGVEVLRSWDLLYAGDRGCGCLFGPGNPNIDDSDLIVLE